MMNGILIIDKPEGLTSAEVVRRVKRGLSVKVGHLGTLDPFASGVLPLCLGEGTKIAQFLNTANKTYVGAIRLGEATDTGDRTGAVVRTMPVPPLGPEELRAIEERFQGDCTQVPPMYSALKRAGVPLYKLARQGIEVQRVGRPVRIESLRLHPIDETHLGFEVSCSKGTYVRVLAEDIGQALGSAAHLSALRRTRFGEFTLDEAVPLSVWDPRMSRGFLPVREALRHLPVVELDATAIRAVQRGQGWVLAQIEPVAGDIAVVVGGVGGVVAVIVRKGGRWGFGRVLEGEQPLQGEAPMLGKKAK